MTDTVNKGIIGVCASMFGIAMSNVTIIVWLQIASLLGGIAVAVLTSVSIWLSIMRKIRARRLEQSIEDKMKHRHTSMQDETTTT